MVAGEEVHQGSGRDQVVDDMARQVTPAFVRTQHIADNHMGAALCQGGTESGVSIEA